MIAAARTIGIEVLALNAVRDEPLPGWTRPRNVAGGRDVVGRDGVAEQREDARATDRANAGRLHPHVTEIRRILDVRGTVVPREGLAAWYVQFLPEFIAAEHVGVLRLEEVALDAAIDLLLDFLRAGPDIAQEDRTVAPDA